MKPKKKTKVRKGLTLEDMAHFIIYRELDKMKVLFPYEKATKICNELREIVNYRSSKK
jgi:hypothetical protein